MEELIKTFHIETGLVIAQLVNFAIVLFVLYKFAYKPILKNLNDRTKKIEKGVEDAKNAEKRLEQIAEKEKEVLVSARKEAQAIIKKSEEDAKKNADNIAAEAKVQTEKMIGETKKAIENEKKNMLTEVKSEIAGLVILATEKLISEKLDKEKNQKIIESVIK